MALPSGGVLLGCHHSLEGIVGAVGIGYLAHAPADMIRITTNPAPQPRFGETVVMAPDARRDDMVALATRVYRGFERCVSAGCRFKRKGLCPATCDSACARKLVYAAACDGDEVAEAIHRYLRLGFSEGPRMRDLVSRGEFAQLDDLARRTLSECERTRQFVRFSELRDGSFLAVFRPQADTLPLTIKHFIARMGDERFCIVDPVHGTATFYDGCGLRGKRGSHAIARLDRELIDRLVQRDDYAADEHYVRAMWKRFYDSLALPGRGKDDRGYDLRMHWMPKRYWGGLTELDPGSDAGVGHVPRRYANAG